MLPRILQNILANPVALLAAASPLIINLVQAKRAKLEAEAAHRASELKQASAIADEVFTATDNLAYLSKRAMFSVVLAGQGTDDDNKEVWKAYQEALMKWESSKSTTLAYTEMYFGVDNAGRLKSIQDDFETLANQINAASFQRTTSEWFIEDKEGSPNDFRTKFFPVWDRIMATLMELSREMIRHIQYEEVGSLRAEG